MTNYDLMHEIIEIERLLFDKAKQEAARILAETPNMPLTKVAAAAVLECNGEFFTALFDGVKLKLWNYLELYYKNEEFTKGA